MPRTPPFPLVVFVSPSCIRFTSSCRLNGPTFFFVGVFPPPPPCIFSTEALNSLTPSDGLAKSYIFSSCSYLWFSVTTSFSTASFLFFLDNSLRKSSVIMVLHPGLLSVLELPHPFFFFGADLGLKPHRTYAPPRHFFLPPPRHPVRCDFRCS